MNTGYSQKHQQKKQINILCVLVMISLNRNGTFHSYAMHY